MVAILCGYCWFDCSEYLLTCHIPPSQNSMTHLWSSRMTRSCDDMENSLQVVSTSCTILVCPVWSTLVGGMGWGLHWWKLPFSFSSPLFWKEHPASEVTLTRTYNCWLLYPKANCSYFINCYPWLSLFLFSDVSWIMFSAYVGSPETQFYCCKLSFKDLQQCHISPPSSVYTGYFKLLSVATTLMQQLVLECSLMSVPPGCGPLLPVNTSGLICCIITIWLMLMSLKSKRIKAGVLELCPSMVM